MKNLSQFSKFDWEAFSHGKEFLVTGCSQLLDFNTKEHVGTRVDCVIYSDNTPYKQRNGETVTNRFEKLTFKVMKKDVSVPVNSMVTVHNAVAVIYGEYQNQLSVTCDDITVITQQQHTQKEAK